MSPADEARLIAMLQARRVRLLVRLYYGLGEKLMRDAMIWTPKNRFRG